MAVTIDIGEGDNIHPKNKQELGRRLALIARARVYGEPVACSGPVYRTYRIEGDKIRIRFDEAEGLAVRDGRVLRGFAVAGADRRFHWAEAAIDGCDVVVGSPEVPYPLAVRYGWDDNPDCNLINAFGLPASPVPDRPLAGNHDRQEIIRILSANEHRVSSCRRSCSHVFPGTVFADDGQFVRAGI